MVTGVGDERNELYSVAQWPASPPSEETSTRPDASGQ